MKNESWISLQKIFREIVSLRKNRSISDIFEIMYLRHLLRLREMNIRLRTYMNYSVGQKSERLPYFTL